MSYVPGNSPYTRENKTDITRGHAKSKVLSQLQVIRNPSSNTQETRYGLSDASMEIIKNEFNLMPIQLLPLLIDHVNDTETNMPSGALASLDTVGTAEIQDRSVTGAVQMESVGLLQGNAKSEYVLFV